MKVLGTASSLLTMAQAPRAKGISAGYLPQDGLTLSGRSIFCRMHVGLRRAPCHGKKKWSRLPHSMSELDHTRRGLCRCRRPLSENSSTNSRAPRWFTHWRRKWGRSLHRSRLPTAMIGRGNTERILRRLGKMRIALAKLLLQKAQLAPARRAHKTISTSKLATGWREYLTSYPYAYVSDLAWTVTSST